MKIHDDIHNYNIQQIQKNKCNIETGNTVQINHIHNCNVCRAV